MSIRKESLVIGDVYQLYGRRIAVFVGFEGYSGKAVFRMDDGKEIAVRMDCVYKHLGKVSE